MVNLHGDFYLDADGNCFLLQEWDGKTRTDKKGNVTNAYKSILYYSDLASLLNGFAKALLRKGIQESNTIAELSDKVDEIKDICLDVSLKVS